MTEQNTNMSTQQTHLKSLVEQQKQIIMELNELNNQVNIKKEQAIKLQGVIEYLTQLGVTLEEPSQESNTLIEPEVA